MATVQTVFRLRIHAEGTATPTDGTVDFTVADLAEVPQFGGQLVEPTRGRSVLGQWSFEAVDTGGVITSNLSNPSTGRGDLIGRLAEVQENRDGGGWTTLSVARLTGVSLQSEEQARYRIEVSDERWVERAATVFTAADTVNLWPPSLRYGWRNLDPFSSAGIGAIPHLRETSAESLPGGVRVRCADIAAIPEEVIQWMKRDLVDQPIIGRTDGLGNFEHLRFHANGTDYEIVGFGPEVDAESPIAALNTGESLRTLDIWVAGGGALVGQTLQAYLWAPTAPPSTAIPLHVGTRTFDWADSGHTWGFLHPFDLLEAIYTAAGVRYDPAALATLQAKPYPNLAWRITDPNLDVARFVEEQIYAPLGVVPFVDDQGRVSPRSVRLPDAEDVDPSALFQFHAGNVATAPSFEQIADDVINAVTIEGRSYSSRFANFGPTVVAILPYDYDQDDETGADRIVEREITIGPRVLAGVSQGAGQRPLVIQAHGFMVYPEGSVAAVYGTSGLRNATAWIAQETFDRFGDGPVRATFRALRTPQDGGGRTAEGVQPGDLVVLNIPTWPNLATQSRGGARIVQIMSKRPGPLGIDFDALDVGPSLQPVAAPTCSVALNAGSPRHAVDVTVGSVAASHAAEVRYAVTAAGAASVPASAWVVHDGRLGSPGGTLTLPRLPSGSKIWVQARAVAPGRVRSLWSSTATVTTTALAAPTGLAATAVGRAMKLTWSIGQAGYPLLPVFRPAGGGSWTDALETPLPPGSTAYTFDPQAPSTSYDWGVRHVDRYGGLGPVAFVTQATSTARKLAAPRAPRVLQGRADGGIDDLPPEQLRIGYGIEVGFNPSEPAANTVAQVSTDSGFGTVDLEVSIGPGASSIRIFTNGLDETVRYIRLLHRRDGNADSDPSDIVTSKPTALVAVAGNDAFPGGIAEVTEVAGGKLEIFIQDAGDPNTASAFYAWLVDPVPEDFPPVDGTSRQVTLPVRENLNLDDGDPPTEQVFSSGEVILIQVRFADALGAFGQSVLIRHVYGEFIDPGPTVTWRQAVPDPPNVNNKEAVEFVVTDESGQVAFWFQTYDEGSAPAAWDAAVHRHTDGDLVPDPTGYAADPLVVKVEETRPAEGGTNRIIRYRGEDGAGQFSDEHVLRIDGDREPSGKFIVPLLQVGDLAAFISDSDDPDAGSWRARIKEVSLGDDGDFDPVTWVDGANEVAGATMDALIELAGKTLTGTNQFNVEGYYLGTTAVDGASQQASARSALVRAIIRAAPDTIVPQVGVEFEYQAGQARVKLSITDPAGLVTGTAFDGALGPNPAFNADPGLWTEVDFTEPYAVVSNWYDLGQKHLLYLAYAVRADLQDGAGDVWIVRDVVAVDIDSIPEVTANATIGPNAEVEFDYDGDDDTLSVKYLVSKSAFPLRADVLSTGTVVDGRKGSETSTTTLADGERGHITIVPYSGAAGSGSAGPELEVRTPVYQTGGGDPGNLPGNTIVVTGIRWVDNGVAGQVGIKVSVQLGPDVQDIKMSYTHPGTSAKTTGYVFDVTGDDVTGPTLEFDLPVRDAGGSLVAWIIGSPPSKVRVYLTPNDGTTDGTEVVAALDPFDSSTSGGTRTYDGTNDRHMQSIRFTGPVTIDGSGNVGVDRTQLWQKGTGAPPALLDGEVYFRHS